MTTITRSFKRLDLKRKQERDRKEAYCNIHPQLNEIKKRTSLKNNIFGSLHHTEQIYSKPFLLILLQKIYTRRKLRVNVL